MDEDSPTMSAKGCCISVQSSAVELQLQILVNNMFKIAPGFSAAKFILQLRDGQQVTQVALAEIKKDVTNCAAKQLKSSRKI